MARQRPRFVSTLIAQMARTFGRITAILPLPVCRALGKLIGCLAYGLIPRIRRVTYANLRGAYGAQFSPREYKRLARKAAENMGIVASEFSHIRVITPDFVQSHVDIVGREHLDTTRGGLVLGAHLGNWEWMAPVVQTFFPKTAEVVRPLDHPQLDTYVDGIRRSNGVLTVRKQGAGGEIVRLLREGYLVGVLADQSPRQSAVPVTFFGKRCWATVAPLVAAIRAKAPIYLMSLTRQPNGRYLMTISEPIRWKEESNLRSALPRYAQDIQDRIEALVRKTPEQWLWAHRRWKTRHRLEEEWQTHNPIPH